MVKFKEFMKNPSKHLSKTLNNNIIITESKVHRNTPKSHVVILNTNNSKKYIVKLSHSVNKEMLVYELAKRFELFNTFNLVYHGENFFITEFEKELKHLHFKDYFEDFIRFQTTSIKNHKSLEKIIQNNEDFRNLNLERVFIRLEKHKDLVKNYYTNPEKLKDFIEENTNLCSNFPNIIALGDINDENIRKSNGKFIYFDFELAVYSKPTWDVSTIIFHIDNEKEILMWINKYAEKMSKFEKKEEIIKKVFSDFITNYITIGIGVQQFEYYKSRAPHYLKRINRYFNIILKEAKKLNKTTTFLKQPPIPTYGGLKCMNNLLNK